MSEPKDCVNILRIGLRQVDLPEFVRQDDLLWRAPILATLAEATRLELLGQAHVRSVDAGGSLLAEGVRPQAVHFVLTGSIVLSTAEGSMDLATLDKGDVFGLAALFDDAVRPAAAATEGGARVALLPAVTLTQLIRGVPELGKLLASLAKERHTRANECAEFFDMW